jgi:hypothetical protein
MNTKGQPNTLTAHYDKTSQNFSISLHDPERPQNDATGVVGRDGQTVISNSMTSKKAEKRMKKIVKSILKPRMEACKRLYMVRERMCRKILMKNPDAEIHDFSGDMGGAYF